MKPAAGLTSRTQDGSLVVTKAHAVKKIKINVNPDDYATCGAHTVTVVGAEKLHKIYSGHPNEDEWVVGNYHAGAVLSYDAINTSVKGGGKTYKAKIEMSFNSKDDTETKTFGYVAVQNSPGGICDLSFTLKKA